MTVESLLRALGAPVPSTEEETFELFARDLPSHNLGFIDAKAATLDLTVSGRDLTIHQSPGVLSSNRAGGTTGAVIWKITPLFAEWLSSSSSSNPLFAHGVLNPSSHVVELGCGISGLVALLLAPRVARYVLTDQPYVARLVEQNVAENWRAVSSLSSAAAVSSVAVSGKKSRSKARGTATPHPASPPLPAVSATASTTIPAPRRARGAATARERDRDGPWETKIRFAPLDWETDVVTAALATGPMPSSSDTNKPETISSRSFDAVVACDCVYNEALIEPFVSTCADLCRLRATTATEEGQEGEGGEPCVCVVAQQLRDPLVFEAWLECFAQSFHTWRVPDGMLHEGLRSGSGFVMHVGVLRECGIVVDEVDVKGM